MQIGVPADHALLRRMVEGPKAIVDIGKEMPALRSRFHSRLSTLSAAWYVATDEARARLIENWPTDEFENPTDDLLFYVHLRNGEESPVAISLGEEFEEWNAVYFRRCYFALPKAVGDIDLAKSDLGSLPGFSAWSLHRLRDIIRMMRN